LFLSDATGQCGLLPSEWVLYWAHLVPQGGRVLDVAGGTGRHARVFAKAGCEVTLVDRSTDSLAQAALIPHVLTLQADLEGAPWPLEPAQFDGVVVTNYLWRALFPHVLGAIKPGGILIYETFALGQETIGRPKRPEFLLDRGELLRVCADLHVLGYEDVRRPNPDRFVQRICARKPVKMPG
jgi:SAM-dependent methyltransferase